MPIVTPNFTAPEDVDEADRRAGVPLDLLTCADCGHIQVGSIGNPEFQYRDYVYTTGLSVGLSAHFERCAREVVTTLNLPTGSLVVEIGSNDGTLLRTFKDLGMRVAGVDPARKIAAQATATGIPTVPDFFSPAIAEQIRTRHGPATLVIANNVIANIASLADFGAAVCSLLAPNGVFVFETQYGADVIDRALLDTVYHEHISYFLIRPTRDWLRLSGLELTDVWPIDTKGGSFRAFAKRSTNDRAVTPRVGSWIAGEEAAGMFEQAYFAKLANRLKDIRDRLHDLVAGFRGQGKSVAGFGVSVGTSTLLSQFDLGSVIDALYDDDPKKTACLEGPDYRIPVFPSHALVDHMPGLVIVFAWRYIETIVQNNSEYLAAGGTFVVPLPEVRLIHQADKTPMASRA